MIRPRPLSSVWLWKADGRAASLSVRRQAVATSPRGGRARALPRYRHRETLSAPRGGPSTSLRVCLHELPILTFFYWGCPVGWLITLPKLLSPEEKKMHF